MFANHPDYPPLASPHGDRCLCGGIRHWHNTFGCDDCECTRFQSVELPTPEMMERLHAYLYEGATEIADLEESSGLLLEVISLSYRQLIGPFPKDAADVFEAIELLKSEELPDEEPTQYVVRVLFPPRFAAKAS